MASLRVKAPDFAYVQTYVVSLQHETRNTANFPFRAMAATNKGPKRPRLSSGGGLDITALPEEAWSLVAGCLPKPSVAFLAAAATAPSASWRATNYARQPNELSQTILSSLKHVRWKRKGAGGDQWHGQEGSWEALDFEEPGCADFLLRMSDDDLGAALACIDAKNKLKRLRIGWCVNITGSGLEPLRGAKELQQLDLSNIDRSSEKFSEGVALPILESFIFNSPLRQLCLPRKWCRSAASSYFDPGPSSQLVGGFVRRYTEHLESFSFDCAGHDDPNTCDMAEGARWIDLIGCYGFQNYTCYSCLRNCCRSSRKVAVSKCGSCLRNYCNECIPVSWCCSRSVCSKCAVLASIAIATCATDALSLEIVQGGLFVPNAIQARKKFGRFAPNSRRSTLPVLP